MAAFNLVASVRSSPKHSHDILKRQLATKCTIESDCTTDFAECLPLMAASNLVASVRSSPKHPQPTTHLATPVAAK